MRTLFKTFSSKARGFTLIELLVVIAIIGILASIVLVSLNSARGKGRDAKRVADLQSFVNQVEGTDSNADTHLQFSGCATAGPNTLHSCTTPNGAAYLDPSDAAGTPGTACAAGTLAAVCEYGIGSWSAYATKGPWYDDWELKTYLETGSGSFAAGSTICAKRLPPATTTILSGATNCH